MNPASSVSLPIPPAQPPSRVRAWLVLSRGSNLPTVWSNCLAGWWMGGGWLGETGSLFRVVPMLLGASLLYTAGMWLNDAYDHQWDAAHRSERPIPAGQMPRQTVVWAGWGTVLLGWFCLWPLGLGAVCWTLALTACIETYNRVHKRWPHASWLMAACRFCLYPLGANAGTGFTGLLPLADGLFLALYIAGITYLARGESLPGRPAPRWPWMLLAAPVLGWLFAPWHVIRPPFWQEGLLVPFGLWLWQAWRRTAQGRPPVADLLAGIVLVDLLLTPPLTAWRWMIFGGLFVAARLFQRHVPAT